MGNYLLYPFQKNNNKNTINENNQNNKIEKRNYSPISNNINNNLYPKLNDLTDFGENNNSKFLHNKKKISNSHIYYHGHKHKKMQKSKLLFEDTKEGIIMNNIRRMSLIIFDKKEGKEEKNKNIEEINEDKKPNYMKKYNNNDKFYKYGKKKKKKEKIELNKNQINNENNKENFKLKNSKEKKEKKEKKRNKSDKRQKSEKSSQFMLLNDGNNGFNYLKEINKEKNISNNFYDIDKKEIEKEINNGENEIKEFNESPIKENKKLEIKDTPDEKYFFDEIPFIDNEIKIKKDDTDIKKNITHKETNDESENMISESKLIDSSIYNYSGDAPNNKKEGIGKFVYKNKIGLMSIFENNKIIGPIIVSDLNGNSFQGYVDKNNNLNGYFNSKFNFNKDDLKKRYKYNNNILKYKNLEENQNKNELIVISNYMDFFNKYLNLSTIKYNYYHIESIISNNNINNIGIIKWKNNSKYIGEIKNNMKHGIGLFIWSDDSRYEGEFFEDKMEGWGLIHFSDGKLFQGQILNGIPHGYGEFIWNNNNRYVGNYIKGKKEGFGIYIMNIENNNKIKKDIVTYFGFWKNGKQDGYGIIIKNKKINYVKYKEGKKIRQYDYEIFLGKIYKVVNKKHEKIFFSDLKTLKNLIKSIMQF